MIHSGRSRQAIVVMIIICYFLPILFLSTYSLTQKGDWLLFTLGLIAGICGTCFIFVWICQWEAALRKKFENALLEKNTLVSEYSSKLSKHVAGTFPTTSHEINPQGYKEKGLEVPLSSLDDVMQKNLSECQTQQKALLTEINIKNNVLQELHDEKENLQQHLQTIIDEFASYKNAMQEQVQQKEALIKKCQDALVEQQCHVENKQQQIALLESKERDLTYELKTLLQLVNSDTSPVTQPPYPITSHSILSEDERDPSKIAATQLKRCLDAASKMTGGYHLGNSTRMRDLPVDGYALELRRLFDSLRGENPCIILFYSQKENKLLFVNNQVKNVLGWTPEKFVQNFPEIIQKGLHDWMAGISHLSSQNEAQLHLSVKTKDGQEILLYCLLGLVPSGLFRHHVIGVMI